MSDEKKPDYVALGLEAWMPGNDAKFANTKLGDAAMRGPVDEYMSVLARVTPVHPSVYAELQREWDEAMRKHADDLARQFFSVDRSVDLPGWVTTYDLPKRPLLTKLRDAWRGAVNAWRWGPDEGGEDD